MNGDAPASGHEAHDLIAGDRIAAMGEVHRQIVKSLHDNAVLALHQFRLMIGILGDGIHHLFIRQMDLVILLFLLDQTVGYLAFL